MDKHNDPFGEAQGRPEHGRTDDKAAFGEPRSDERVIFGFWVYLMTDLLVFAALFATFAVLRNNTFGGPAGRDLFNLPFVLSETLFLLSSSFTAGLALLVAHRGDKKQVVIWLLVTFLLGFTFLGMELSEFSKLINEGNGFQRSAFLSSFFTLVGTHGAHIAAGLLWMTVLLWKIFKHGLNSSIIRKLTLFSLFWHFLDIVWIFIFTIVYLMA
jgi:cytochrome o ubiquinol oxidase subunit 3